MLTYIQHHRFALLSALKQITSSWLPSLLTVLVIAMTLVLPMLLWLFVINAEPVVDNWQGDPKATFYLNDGVSEENSEELLNIINESDYVLDAKLISKDDALEVFTENSELGDVLSVLGDNPLPISIVATLDKTANADKVESAVNAIAEDGLVEEVRFDLQWVKRLQAIVAVIKNILTLVVALVLLASMLIISNTIRLIIANRKNELETLNSIGATRAFIARPFLYSGFIKGFTAAVLAFVLVLIALSFVMPSLKHLFGLYFSQHEFVGFSLKQVFMVMLLTSALGWLSSWLTVNVFLLKYRPSA